ncbi:hypothetical protein N7475_000873 [Penicillium sp. IBT 31633x]|nr:hypothetical protein N7475_000873 [Penicillium sp. IBT 31633x]
MPRPKTKTKSENLARIRNNQRRSRAKRLEYVRGLEEKAKKYDELIASNSSPSLSAFDQLQSQNAWMKGLLATLGINMNSLDAPQESIPDNEPNTTMASTVQWPPFHTLWSGGTNGPKVTSWLTGDFGAQEWAENPVPVSFWEQGNRSTLSPDMGVHFNALSLLNENNDMANPELFPVEPTLEASPPQVVQATPEATVPSNSNTTLCSLACQWVIQCNTKGVELDVLYFRMERGFKQGNNPLEGCRVDNDVLLSVLRDIS